MTERPIDAFIEEGSIKLRNGQEVPLPKLSWGVELKIYKKISKALEQILPESAEAPEAISPKVAMKLLTDFGDILSEVAGLILRKDRAWVEENLASEDMMKVILPLSIRIFRKISDGVTEALGAPGEER